MSLMVLVNTPGNSATTYAQLKHVEWHGLTLADTIYPTFLWIVGIALVFSLGKKLKQGSNHKAILWVVLRRAIILFLLGLFINGFPYFHWSTLRFLGVLQRIAVCYFLGSLLYMKVGFYGRLITTVLLLLGYWALMLYIPVPHYGAGHLDMARNLSHFIDYTILGPHNHLYTKTWDPEGFLGTLPSLATVLFGTLAGDILLNTQNHAKLRTLISIGITLLIVGFAWNFWLPINKNLWTSSFSVFMAGIDFLLLSGLMILTQNKTLLRCFHPFLVFGMNAIFIYVLSEVLEIIFLKLSVHQDLYHFFLTTFHNPYQASFAYALSYVLLMFGFAYALYRNKCFIRI
jgi:predicted acyltransferase